MNKKAEKVNVNQNYTPKPWLRVGTTIFHQRNPGGTKIYIGECFRDCGAEQSEANAQLTSAAPDLLEACKKAMDWYQEVPKGRDWEFIRLAKSAISKAEGKS